MQADFLGLFSLNQISIYSYTATIVVLLCLLKTEGATALDCRWYHHRLSW